MFIWIVLFLIIVSISLLLSVRSMSDYRESPLYFSSKYSLFLVKKPKALTKELLELWHKHTADHQLIISFEKLFKGDRKALVVYGPVEIIAAYKKELDLLELEEYTQKTFPIIFAWELGIKRFAEGNLANLEFSLYSKKLEPSEQIWGQLILRPIKGQDLTFSASVRIVAMADSQDKLKKIRENLEVSWEKTDLGILPKVYTEDQIIKSYQDRSIPASLFNKINQRGGETFLVNSSQVRSFLQIT